MSQNTSSAVMQQRREPADSLDFFPTPPWATRALVEHVIHGGGWAAGMLADMVAEDPCCGAGDMVRPLAEYFGEVRATDVHDYGWGHVVADWLQPVKVARAPDFCIFNPPFRLAEAFVARALGLGTRQAVCALVRTAFLEGTGRHERLFSVHRPLAVAQFTERVVMHKGRLSATGSTATAYCWIVWPGRDVRRTSIDTRFQWIPPCRKALERPGDYPEPEPGPAPAAMTLLEGVEP